MRIIKILEVIGGMMLFIPRTRALGLCIITPIVVNILIFELLVSKQPGIGIALMIVNIVAIAIARDKFKSLME